MMKDTVHLYDPVDLDTTCIEILTDEADLFAFQVTLSGSPDLLWKLAFEEVWKESRHPAKLDARVLENSIRFICRQSQTLEDYLYLIESRIEATNARMWAYWESLGIQAERIEYLRYPSTYIPLKGAR